jgi:hypothetical protein
MFVTRVVCDNVLHLQLDDLKNELEVCDKSGRVLGRFLPEAVYERLGGAQAADDFTEQELVAAEQQPGGMTTAEVLAHLKSL